MSGNSKKLIAFNYFGGKMTFLDYLFQYFPVHYHFVDLFCGSMVVTLNKSRSKIETANDINGYIVNFFKVLREKPEELIRLLKLTPVSREEFNNSWKMDDCSDIEKARRFYVRVRQSFHGQGAQRQNKGWHLTTTISRSNLCETVSRWHNGIDKLLQIIELLSHIQIENRDFRKVVEKIDYPEAFFYCDPPYPKEVRGSFNDYCFEFSEQDHRDLAELLNNMQGKAMVSGYSGPLYKELYEDKGWQRIEFPIKYNNLRKTRVQECIWINYDLSVVQLKMFNY